MEHTKISPTDGVKLQDALVSPQILTPRRLQTLLLEDGFEPFRFALYENETFKTSSKIALQAFLQQQGHYIGPIEGDRAHDGRRFGNAESTKALQKMLRMAETGSGGEATIRKL
eukprot:3574029-Prymnesium_polylepis.1